MSNRDELSNTATSINNQKYNDQLNAQSKCCNCWEKKRGYKVNSLLDNDDNNGGGEYVCRHRFCCKWFCGIGSVLLIIFLLILFLAYIPSAAQSAMDNASLLSVYLAMNNPTNDSIELNATMRIVNAGPYKATVESGTSSLWYNGVKIGTMKQPQIDLEPHTGATFTVESTIKMTTDIGRKAFANITRKILSGHDGIITFKSKPDIKLHLGPASISISSVSMNKDVNIPGSAMQFPNIKNFTILNMTATGIAGIAEIEFGVAGSLHFYTEQASMLIYDVWNNQLGTAHIPVMQLKPGYNRLTEISTQLLVCTNCSNVSRSNLPAIQAFALDYEGGISQILNMRGPVPGLVISNTLNSDAFLYGYCSPPSDE